MASRTNVQIVVAQLCAPYPGGTGRYTEGLVRALYETRTAGRIVSGLTTRTCVAVAALPMPVRELHLPGPLVARLWERGLPPRPRAAGVVHAPTLLVPPVSASQSLVVTIHDVVPWTHPETLTRRGVSFHRRMGERAMSHADVVVTPTSAVATQVRALLSPQCAVVTVHSGVSVTPRPTDAVQRRAALGVPARYVLFVGTAEPRKGLDLLVEAMCVIPGAGLDLVVAGPEGWGNVSVSDLARAAGVADRVHVTGRVSEADLAALYDGAQVVALPSRAEGFGYPVVEAMSYGIPVVTSDDPALVEVGAGVAAVAPVSDVDALGAAISRLADGGPERDDTIARGIARAADFDWTLTATRMWEIYASLVGR